MGDQGPSLLEPSMAIIDRRLLQDAAMNTSSRSYLPKATELLTVWFRKPVFCQKVDVGPLGK